MAVSADAQAAADHVTQVLQADPVLGPLLKQQAAGQPFDANAANLRLQQLGITLPQGMWISGGKVQHENMTVDNIGKALKIAIPAVIGAYGVGALAGAGGAASGGAAGTAGTTAATTTAAASTPSLLHSLLPTIIGAGTQLAGAGIAAHGNSEATKAQTEAADKALAVTEQQYALQRQDTAPYRALGQGAVGNLGYLSGIDVESRVPELSSTVPKVPYGQTAPMAAPTAAAPAQNLSTLGAPSPQASGFVSMKTPDGRIVNVPQAQVADAQQHGGVPA